MAQESKRHTMYQDFDPEAPETTEFRRIFTRISRRGETERLRTILFTSAERGEGKTTSVALFAMVAALHQGLRTCLVDADLHRPRIEKLFDTAREPGFADILENDVSIETTLKPSRYETLKIIPAGGRRPFPSELLIPDRLSATLGKLKLLFDLIVLDAPPLLPVSDPAVISREVDGVVMIVRAGRTQRDVALRGKRILDDVGANLLGVIVNNVDDVLPYYYGHTYYQYGYKDGEPPKPAEERSRTVESKAPQNERKELPVRSKAAGG